MRLMLLLVGFLGLVVSAVAFRAEDEPAASPLHLIPADVDFFLQVRDPSRLAEVAGKLEVLTKLVELPLVKDQLDSTNLRRARQLLAYTEKKLGAKWPDLLAKIAGGGAAVGAKFGDNAPALVVLRGTDEKMTKQFVALAVELLEDELARQESKDRIVKTTENGIEHYTVGQGVFAARAGSAILLSNKKDALARGIALHLGKDKKSLATLASVVEADKILPQKPLIDAWVNMETVQKNPQAKDLYKSPRDNFILTLSFGSTLDILGRTPFVAAALAQDKDGFFATVRAPRGRDGMGIDRVLHVTPADQPGVRPLLKPKGVLYSSTFYYDAAKIWQDREKLFPKAIADNLVQTDKNSGRVMLGTKMSQLFESVGERHRLVVANQSKSIYKRTSQVTLPAFGLVSEMRNPTRFNRTADLALRAAALALSGQFNMELAEEKYKEVDIVAYRFDEKADVPADVNDIRFALSPCWARVGKQFIACSTLELCRELIDTLQAEEKSPPENLKVNGQDRFYSAGFAGAMRGVEDQLITQAILGQAIEPAEAKKQVGQVIDLLAGLGDTTTSTEYREKEWRYEMRFGKKD